MLTMRQLRDLPPMAEGALVAGADGLDREILWAAVVDIPQADEWVRADELLLCEIDADFEGATRFPAWDRTQFGEVRREYHRAAPPNDFDFSFVSYRRR